MLHPSWVDNILAFFWKLLTYFTYLNFPEDPVTQQSTLLRGNPDDFLESLPGRSPKGCSVYIELTLVQKVGNQSFLSN